MVIKNMFFNIVYLQKKYYGYSENTRVQVCF